MPATPNAASAIPIAQPIVPITPLPMFLFAMYSANLLDATCSPFCFRFSIFSIVFSNLAY